MPDQNVVPTKKLKSNETDTDELNKKILNQNQEYYKLYDVLKTVKKVKQIGLQILKDNDQAIVSGESVSRTFRSNEQNKLIVEFSL